MDERAELHPGEKRLLTYATTECPHLPTTMVADVQAVLSSAATADQHLIAHITTLLDRLDELLEQHGFDGQMRQQSEEGETQ